MPGAGGVTALKHYFQSFTLDQTANEHVRRNTDEICEETLGDALMVVFGQPMEPFEDHEVTYRSSPCTG